MISLVIMAGGIIGSRGWKGLRETDNGLGGWVLRRIVIGDPLKGAIVRMVVGIGDVHSSVLGVVAHGVNFSISGCYDPFAAKWFKNNLFSKYKKIKDIKNKF